MARLPLKSKSIDSPFTAAAKGRDAVCRAGRSRPSKKNAIRAGLKSGPNRATAKRAAVLGDGSVFRAYSAGTTALLRRPLSRRTSSSRHFLSELTRMTTPSASMMIDIAALNTLNPVAAGLR